DSNQINLPEIPKHRGGGVVVLHARVEWCVDGLDLALYDESISIRRKFEDF
ncbi:hypothetical protein HK096_006672, partial [Nowakowskiella sp. JEL0078]